MKIGRNISLTDRNTFGMKVSCACLVEYDSPEEYRELLSSEVFHTLPLPFLHIGGGSNLLFTADFPGTVFHSRIDFLKELSRDGDSVRIEAGAGTLWDKVCLYCAENGLWGTENLSGIPGETGAAAVQNIGAYGAEIKDVVESVVCFDSVNRGMKSIRGEDCRYDYRTSMFKEGAKGRYVVMSVVLRLSSVPKPKLGYGHLKAAVDALTDGAEPEPMTVRKAVLGIRNAKLPDPAVTGNAGSFFKNPVVPRSSYEVVENYALSLYGPDYIVPHFDVGAGFVKIPAAWLIEQCGWKGYREGNVGVYEKQPLVIINATGNAVPGEILSLEKKITESVINTFGIELTPEVEHI